MVKRNALPCDCRKHYYADRDRTIKLNIAEESSDVALDSRYSRSCNPESCCHNGGVRMFMKIELTNEQALVLSDWLHRNSRKESLFEDIAEQYVFWDMECQLEKELVEPFMENYNEILASARDTVKKNY